MRVAVVHDWLTGMRGGEKVLEAVFGLFPGAELYTLVHRRGSVSPVIEGRRVHRSIVDRLPLSASRYREYLPLFPFAVEQFGFDDVDLVISSSHCAAKSVVVPGRTAHVCYCHSPMRYAWDQFEAYFGQARVGRPASAGLRRVMAWLAQWDRATEGRVDRYVANSQYVAGRIGRYYNRVASVVYPPVQTDFFTPDAARPRTHYLIVSALVPYKRVELAIDACRQLGRPLVVAGDGPDRARLERRADGSVTFTGAASDEEIRDLYRAAHAVLLPGEEDFGIVPVEAQACGTPVVALARGGALETVTDGATGVHVAEPTAEAFANGLARAEGINWDRATLRANAERFSAAAFATGFTAIVDDTLARHSGRELSTGTGTGQC
ncbi:MAG TPA: glycosyltransferase [Vicinamibacterales bacterium]|nr:glycosyltransferase [Vicinamibacterales bacterium]